MKEVGNKKNKKFKENNTGKRDRFSE